jgi:hypothetical protein
MDDGKVLIVNLSKGRLGNQVGSEDAELIAQQLGKYPVRSPPKISPDCRSTPPTPAC